MASLCKVVYLFQDNIVPPNVHLHTLNPRVKWKEYKLRVPVESEEIRARDKTGNGRLLVSMNSSGIGGSNAHVVLESWRPPQGQIQKNNNNNKERGGVDPKLPVLLLSGALSEGTTAAVAKQLTSLVDGDNSKTQRQELAEIALGYGRRGMQMNWRSFSVVLPGATPQFSAPRFVPRNRPALVYVLSGQGPQHINMGRQLFAHHPIFRSSILSLDSHYQSVTGHSLIARTGLFSSSPHIQPSTLPDIWPIEVTLPAIAMVQLALIDLLGDWGVRPDAVVGHSAGETTMLYACGAGGKGMALEIAIARGLAVAELEGLRGSMVAFSCDPIVADEIIDEVRATTPGGGEGMILDVACFNAENAVVLAGHVELLEKAKGVAKARGIGFNQIQTKVPFHSTMMDLCKRSYIEKVEAVFDKYLGPNAAGGGECKAKIPAYSTMTALPFTDDFTSDYFWDNARSPVEFLSAVNSILRDFPNATFLEISPHPVLSSYVSSIRGSTDVVFCPMRRKREYPAYGEYTQLLESIGGLAVTGSCDGIDMRRLTGVERPTARVGLKFKYPFNKKELPYYSDLLRAKLDWMSERWRGPLCSEPLYLGAATHPDLAEHVINSQSIMAAAGYLEMGFELGGRVLWNVNFRSMLPLISEKTISVEVKQEDSRWSVSSYKPGDLSTPRLHTDGFMSATPLNAPAPSFDIKAIMSRCKMVEREEFYEPINHFAQYGPLFKRVNCFYRGNNEGLAEVRGFADDLIAAGHQYRVHPAILDACFHAMVLPAAADNDPTTYYLPFSVEYVALHQPELFPKDQSPAETVYAYVKMKSWAPEEIKFDLEVLLPNGQSALSLHGFTVARHLKITESISSTRQFDIVYQPYSLPTKKFVPAKDVHTSLRSVVDFAVEAGKKVIRVLELGASTSQLLSNPDISSLIQRPSETTTAAIHYVCADKSPVPVPSFAHFTKFDMERPVPSSMLSTFDVVLASDSLEGNNALSTTFDLLLPGGVLILSENDKIEIVQKPVLSLSSITSSSSSSSSKEEEGEEVAVLAFHEDQALSLQSSIAHFQKQGPKSIWIQTSTGVSSGYAAGFTRTLRLECPDLQIHLVEFDPRWTQVRRETFIKGMAGMEGRGKGMKNVENELRVDADGRVWVPRIVETSVTNSELGEGVVISPESVRAPTEVPEDHVLVKVEESTERDGFRGFVGKVMRTEGAQWKEGDEVIGLVTVEEMEFPTQYVVVHQGHLALISSSSSSTSSSGVSSSSGLNKSTLASLALPMTILGMALGTSNIRDLRRVQKKRIGIVSSDSSSSGSGSGGASSLDQVLRDMLVSLGLDAQLTSPSPPSSSSSSGSGSESSGSWSPDERSIEILRKSDYVIASDEKKMKVMEGCTKPDTPVCVWKDSSEVSGGLGRGLGSVMKRDEWLVGDVLGVFREWFGVFAKMGVNNTSAEKKGEKGVVEKPIANLKTLFRADRTYILLGGIGSIGMKVSLWMYENGARNIVLTSRSGSSTLSKPRYQAGQRIASYMSTLPNLSLRLEACDGSDPSQMRRLIQSCSSSSSSSSGGGGGGELPAAPAAPVAGIMLMSAAINDKLFSAHDKESWETSFRSKVGVLRALEGVVRVEDLDFLISFSSATILGSVGQTNYASANSAIDGIIKKHPNAFSMVIPAILDSALFDATNELNTDVTRWSTWGMTCRELCHHIRLGLIKMRKQPFFLYIPPYDWDKASAGLGGSCISMFDHLLSGADSAGGAAGKGDTSEATIRQIILSFIDVNEDDFSRTTPLTSYGLDSLSAGNLSVALRPYLQIAQMQLLSDITLEDIVGLIASSGGDDDEGSGSGGGGSSSVFFLPLLPILRRDDHQIKRFDWKRLNQPGETVIKLIDRPGTIPLILTHGGGGNLLTYMPLQEHFNTSLWGVQVTPETPWDTVHATAKFYYDRIKEQRPNGPYRIGGYCASALIAYELVYIFQSAGDEITQFVMLDFSPAIFTSYHFTEAIDEEMIRTKSPSKNFITVALHLMDKMTELDVSESAKAVVGEIWDCHNGVEVRDFIKLQYHSFCSIGIGFAHLLFELAAEGSEDPLAVLRDPAALEQRIFKWAGRVKIPLQLYLPRHSGARSLYAEGDPEWELLKSEQYSTKYKRFDVNGGHLTMFDDPKLAQFLENGDNLQF
ncbi:hypothetical protein K435DRAFT_966925 [Dendrothele bispora CBS 962.96]|uniref:PKS/mFAS DH domain-containing protein n=1 Tax=Dendrothele bispora (strain CBS 962.96) TaxID=1314807 RepID=A0A4S8LYK5_DENBC|nr:hypothetical protein K435DRAFT_966925 [Dendrothele bispora CBS 962.96]